MGGTREDGRPATPRSAAGERTVAADGRVWRVYERHDQHDRSRGGVLVFQSGDAYRFVRRYPLNWRELPDQDLCALNRLR